MNGKKQREYARDRKYRAQALLRDVLRGFASRFGQCHAGELVNEADAYRCSYDGQDHHHALFIHCPTTWSVVGWAILIVVVVMAINANRSN